MFAFLARRVCHQTLTLTAVFFLLASSTPLGCFADADADATAVRALQPFKGPRLQPDGTYGFQLSKKDAATIAASAGAGAEPVTVAELPRGDILRASEALSSPLGRKISARVREASDKAVLPVMQAGFVLSITDLALAAAVLAHAAKHPAAWRPPDDAKRSRMKTAMKPKAIVSVDAAGGGGAADFLASVDAEPPRGLFAWTPEELVRNVKSASCLWAHPPRSY